jgi:hypothetical protein
MDDLRLQLDELARALREARTAPLPERFVRADYALGLAVELLGELVARVVELEGRAKR